MNLLAADLPAWLVRLSSFVFGALWGSFFNVAIYRWPRGMSVVTPKSHCPACGAPVRWYLNVPIVGYALLRGKAGCCGAPLTPRYVWVELLTAVLALAVAETFFVRAPEGTTFSLALLSTLLYFAFVGGLVIATFVDLEWMEIPDEVSLPGAALGLATVGLRIGPTPLQAAVGAGVGFLVVQLLFVWAYELLTGRRGMGEGDAKLLLMIGAFLGWEAVLFCLVAGSVQGLAAAGIALVAGAPLVPTRPDEEEAPEKPRQIDQAAAKTAPERRLSVSWDAVTDPPQKRASTDWDATTDPPTKRASTDWDAATDPPTKRASLDWDAATDPPTKRASLDWDATTDPPAKRASLDWDATTDPPAALPPMRGGRDDSVPTPNDSVPTPTPVPVPLSGPVAVRSPLKASPPPLQGPAPAETPEPVGAPAMIVFGPMLALSALEYLFFAEHIRSWVGAFLQR